MSRPVPASLSTACLAVLAFTSLPPGAARAELQPSQVAVIAARGNVESEQLARYYAEARAIPLANVCLIDVPAVEECPRAVWDDAIRPAIRQWLDANDPDRTLRCLVTVWGVPLKVAAAEPSAEIVAYQAFLEGERQHRLELIHNTVKAFDAIAPIGEITTDVVGQAPPAASPGVAGGDASAEGSTAADPTTPGSPAELQQLERELESALKAAQARLTVLPAGAARQAAQAQLQQLVATTGGAAVLLRNIDAQLRSGTQTNETLQMEFHRLRGAGSAWVEARQLLEQQPPTINRDVAALGIIERLGGQLAAIPWIDSQLGALRLNESHASFDSELALVLWPAGYATFRWQPNYLSLAYRHSQLREAFPTLMTARLDAPTRELARGMVDAALDAERDGLTGKAYFDSRGLAAQATPETAATETAAFDRSVLAAAEQLRATTMLEVGVNDQTPLFSPGECPDAALYCGWYSLGKYVDAFDWNRGAVAYHVASDEANALHEPDSQRWCKRLIEDGAAATIGPVYEPYLAAFPRPDVFYGLLTQGDLSLAECYWQSQPWTSWTLVLLGDPLYRPFKNHSVKREASAIREAGR